MVLNLLIHISQISGYTQQSDAKVKKLNYSQPQRWQKAALMRGHSQRKAKIQQGGQGENSFTCFPLCHHRTEWGLALVEMQLLIYILVLCSQAGFGAELFQGKTEPPHAFHARLC